MKTFKRKTRKNDSKRRRCCRIMFSNFPLPQNIGNNDDDLPHSIDFLPFFLLRTIPTPYLNQACSTNATLVTANNPSQLMPPCETTPILVKHTTPHHTTRPPPTNTKSFSQPSHTWLLGRSRVCLMLEAFQPNRKITAHPVPLSSLLLLVK